MGATDCVLPEKGWKSSHLLGVPRTEHSDDAGLAPNAAHGRMYRLTGQREDILYIERKLQILSGRDNKARLQKTASPSHKVTFSFHGTPLRL